MIEIADNTKLRKLSAKLAGNTRVIGVTLKLGL